MAGRKELPAELPAEIVSANSETYRNFAQRFGEADANRILQAGAHNRERLRKSDYFIDCLAVAVGYNCLTEYHEAHGFEHSSSEYFDWIRDNISFSEYIGEKNSMTEAFKKTFNAAGLYK